MRVEGPSPRAEDGEVCVGKVRQRVVLRCSCRHTVGTGRSPADPSIPSSALSPWLGGTWLLPGPSAPSLCLQHCAVPA